MSTPDVLERSCEKTEERIDLMRNVLLDRVPEICPERAVLITEAYSTNEGQPFIMKKALALEKILSEMSIYIENDQLIAGNQARAPRAAPIFPEYAVDWILEEMEGFPVRTGDVFSISAETIRTLKGVLPYWKGKTHEDRVLRLLPDDVKKAWDAGIISPGGITHTGDGHIIVDWFDIVDRGLPGYKKMLVERLQGLDLTKPEDLRKREFYEAAVIGVDAALAYVKRYLDLIEQKAAAEAGKERKSELLRIASACKEVIEGKPKSFHGALQLVMFVHIILQIESNGHSYSFGRLDQYLYPFYRADIDRGALSYEEALTLVACAFVKMNTINKVRPWGHTEFGVGYATYQNLVIGGVKPDGSDGTNELSFLCLEADRMVRLFQPNMAARIHPKTSGRFFSQCAECIRLGYGKPALYNDQTVIASLMELGIPLADARSYAMVGCVTPVVPGKWNHRPTGMSFMNVTKMLELAMSGGEDRRTGLKLLHAEKELGDFDSIEELWEEFRRQFSYYTSLCIKADNICDLSLEEHDADPFCSVFVKDCVERGKTAKTGGAVYDFTSGLITGASTAGDSISAIHELVFEKKKVSAAELLDAMESNWETDEGKRIRELCRRAPKFGNDVAEADGNVARIYWMYREISGHYRTLRHGTESFGCRWTPSTATISANTPMGAVCGATPDGRTAGFPVNEGASPCHGADMMGPTATMLSVARLPNMEMSGGQLLNMKFDPGALEGEAGIRKFMTLVHTFFQLGGFHVQFNVVSLETLKDAKRHPEKHKDLIIRVAAYCALFTALAPEVQDEIIARTEHTRI
ncbi:MAG: formate C-acetyltransferase/glycerol dehydratase family glycyl radical enzyme [Spirochaetes bacterium]|nr:formate C-acetyltransferase/glycerol dehydratase family glycyl radical enzyme [Spirochaetota bacterium]